MQCKTRKKKATDPDATDVSGLASLEPVAHPFPNKWCPQTEGVERTQTSVPHASTWIHSATQSSQFLSASHQQGSNSSRQGAEACWTQTASVFLSTCPPTPLNFPGSFQRTLPFQNEGKGSFARNKVKFKKRREESNRPVGGGEERGCKN